MSVFKIEVHKRFKDLDPYGHVSNAVVIDYIMEARVRFYRLLDIDMQAVTGQVVVRQEIDYRRPILYSLSPVIVRTWVSDVGNSSFTMTYQILDDQDVAVDAKAVMVCFDVEANKSQIGRAHV